MDSGSLTGILRYPEREEVAYSCEDLWDIEGICGHFSFLCSLVSFVAVVTVSVLCLPACVPLVVRECGRVKR